MGYSGAMHGRDGLVRSGGSARPGAARLLLFLGVVVLVIGGLLGMHAFTSNHIVPTATSHAVEESSHATAATDDGPAGVDACASCGTHDSGGVGMMLMCGMVLLSVLGLAALRLPTGAAVLLQRLAQRIARPRLCTSHLRPSLVALSISRT